MEQQKKLRLQELITNLNEAEKVVKTTTEEMLQILTNEFGEQYYNHFLDDDFFSGPINDYKELLNPDALLEYFKKQITIYNQ